MKISRRDFIKSGAAGLLGGIILYTTPPVLRSLVQARGIANHTSAARRGINSLERHYWGFVCDNEKCIGCGRCVVACKLENKVPWEPEYNRTWIERYVITEEDEIFVDSPNAGRDGFAAEPINE